MQPSDRWAATHAHVRALLVATVGITASVIGQRSDLLLLVTPLVIVLIWSVLTRPATVPTRRMTVSPPVLREGDRAHLVVRTEHVPGMDLVATSVADSPWVRLRPPHGSRVHLAGAEDRQAGTVQLTTGADPQRWGTRRIGPGLVGAASPWGAFRWGPVPLPETSVRALPNPSVFDASAPAPHPRGLVGLHRSLRPGEGSEFASIRPFQWGDRLKRIHWARSLRSGELHVTSSYADQDTHVAVIVDAHYDLGVSGGVSGSPSSLDHTVRAAAAISEHFLHQGDRVSLQVFSARTPVRVPAGAGRRHGRRILETLTTIVPSPQEETDHRQVRFGLRAGTLVVMISALISPQALTHAAMLARSGLSVVVIDALGQDITSPGEQEPIGILAWRIRMLERAREVRRIQQAGVPVVPWRGPGSLDVVLRSLARRGRQGMVG